MTILVRLTRLMPAATSKGIDWYVPRRNAIPDCLEHWGRLRSIANGRCALPTKDSHVSALSYLAWECKCRTTPKIGSRPCRVHSAPPSTGWPLKGDRAVFLGLEEHRSGKVGRRVCGVPCRRLETILWWVALPSPLFSHPGIKHLWKGQYLRCSENFSCFTNKQVPWVELFSPHTCFMNTHVQHPFSCPFPTLVAKGFDSRAISWRCYGAQKLFIALQAVSSRSTFSCKWVKGLDKITLFFFWCTIPLKLSRTSHCLR